MAGQGKTGGNRSLAFAYGKDPLCYEAPSALHSSGWAERVPEIRTVPCPPHGSPGDTSREFRVQRRISTESSSFDEIGVLVTRPSRRLKAMMSS